MRFLFFLTCFTVHMAQAEIREIKSMKEVIDSLEAETLLVFDIDNTLLEPTGQLGSDQWFYYLYDALKLQGVEASEVPAQAMKIWNETQPLISMKAVEAITPDLVKGQQIRAVKMMALTARTLDIAPLTIKQLQSINISFGEPVALTADFRIPKKELGSADDALFSKGVMLVGESNNKGKVLAYLLKKINLTPKKVVFVDDKFKHVQDMEVIMAGLQIPYVGLRYGAADEKVKVFTEIMAEAKDKKYADLFFYGKTFKK